MALRSNESNASGFRRV